MTSNGGSVSRYRFFPRKPTSIVSIEEVHFDLLRRLEQNPDCTQRELSNEMGISLGKVNYCLKKLVEKGWIKAKNLHNSSNKTAYAYLLTPKGIGEKGKLTIEFLQRKMVEYEILKSEIAQLQEEIEG